jgi:hypothetical protein
VQPTPLPLRFHVVCVQRGDDRCVQDAENFLAVALVNSEVIEQGDSGGKSDVVFLPDVGFDGSPLLVRGADADASVAAEPDIEWVALRGVLGMADEVGPCDERTRRQTGQVGDYGDEQEAVKANVHRHCVWFLQS